MKESLSLRSVFKVVVDPKPRMRSILHTDLCLLDLSLSAQTITR